MAGTFSSKKVARAARTGGGRRRNANTSYPWYALLAAITALGIFIVAFSRDQRLDVNNPGSTPPLAATENRAGDSWFEAYGVYICDKFVANFDPQNDPYGITTSNDGIIHIAPLKREYAGHNATLGRFAKAVDMEIDRDSVKVPGDAKTYGPGEKCGDKEGKFVLKEWSDAKDPKSGKTTDVNPKELLLKDGAAVVVAFVPEGTDIPLPPSVEKLQEVATAGGSTGEKTGAAPQETTTTVANQTTTTTAAPAGGK